MRVLLYARQSKAQERKAPSTAWQVSLLREWAEREGHEVAGVYVDNNLSGYRRVVRPQFERLLADVHTAEAVAVWALDRLTRKGVWGDDILRFISVAKGRRLFSMDEDEDTADETSLSQTLDRARRESAKISRRSKAGKEAAARNGLAVPRGFGHIGPKAVPEEAGRIRTAAERVLSGVSLRRIVLDWNDEGYPTLRGGTWKQVTLRGVLLQPRLVGDRVHFGEVVARDVYEPILTRDTHERLRVKLTDPARRFEVKGLDTHLLTGLIRCEGCGGRMRTTKPANGKRRYQCPPKPEGCNSRVILAEPTEQYVTAALFAALTPEALRERRKEADGTAEASALITDMEERKRELAELWASKDIDRSEWMAARSALDRRIDETRRRMVRSTLTSVVPEGDLRELWAGLPTDHRRSILAAVVHRITIAPATVRTVYDPSRITIEWSL